MVSPSARGRGRSAIEKHLGVAAGIVGFLIGPLITSAVSRRREFLADVAELFIVDPTGPSWFDRLLRSHPPTSERAERLEAMVREF